MNILVTGGLGFIGSHFIEEVLKSDNINLVLNIDCMTYAANRNLNFVKKYGKNRYIDYHINIINPIIEKLLADCDIKQVVHFAAESHVDNSIRYADDFINTNINGTFNLLKCAKSYGKIEKFIHISTDEVFGSLKFEDEPFTINSPYKPNSPYAASKASSDLIVRSYVKTHNFPAIITNCSNNFGPRQFPEKLIPMALNKLKNGEQVPIYGTGKNVRDWIYVKDHVKTLKDILFTGDVGKQYLIGGNNEISNIELIGLLKKRYELLSGKKIRDDYIKFVEDRKGHDLRYAIKNSLDINLTNFDSAIDDTIKSYL